MYIATLEENSMQQFLTNFKRINNRESCRVDQRGCNSVPRFKQYSRETKGGGKVAAVLHVAVKRGMIRCDTSFY